MPVCQTTTCVAIEKQHCMHVWKYTLLRKELNVLSGIIEKDKLIPK
jgi:hypothetical protein